MENEIIYNLGKKLGLNKQDIESVLKSSITSCAVIIIPVISNIYKGSYYGTMSIYEF